MAAGRQRGARAMLLLLVSMACFGLGPHSTAAQPVLGDVELYTEDFTFDPFPDLPADFGPEVPDEGIDGLLLMADPEDACEPFTFTERREPWVALIARAQKPRPTNCTFDVKVRHAERAGARAAVVFDDAYEALIIMSMPPGAREPGIPAVFVSAKAGLVMRKLLVPGSTRVRLTPVSAVAWVSVVMSALLGFLTIGVVVATFYVMRSWSAWLGRTRARRGAPGELGYLLLHGPDATGMSSAAIRALPTVEYAPRAGRGGGGGGQQRRQRRREGAGALAEPLLPAPAEGAEEAECGGGGGGEVQALPPAGEAAGGDVEEGGGGASVATAGGAGSGAGAGAARAESRRKRRQRRRARDAAQRAAAEASDEPAAAAVAPAAAAPAAAAAAAAESSQATVAAALAAAAAALSDDDDAGCGASATTSSSEGAGGDGDGSAGGAAGVPPGSRGGATRRTCVICLERYRAGELVTILPCAHRFHAKCVVSWLSVRRFCPVCKRDATDPPPQRPPRP